MMWQWNILTSSRNFCEVTVYVSKVLHIFFYKKVKQRDTLISVKCSTKKNTEQKDTNILLGQ